MPELEPDPTKVMFLYSLFILGFITAMFTNKVNSGKEIPMLVGGLAGILICIATPLVVIFVSFLDIAITFGFESISVVPLPKLSDGGKEILANYINLIVGLFIGIIYSHVLNINDDIDPKLCIAGAVVLLLIGLSTFFIGSNEKTFIYKAGYQLLSAIYTGLAAGMFGALSNLKPDTESSPSIT